jgi:hypothetical protein
MNTITTSSAGYIATATDLGRTPRRTAASAAAPAETTATAADTLLNIEDANRAAALGSIDDLAGAQAAVAQMRLAFAGQPSAARAAQGAPSAAKALRLLAN